MSIEKIDLSHVASDFQRGFHSLYAFNSMLDPLVTEDDDKLHKNIFDQIRSAGERVQSYTLDNKPLSDHEITERHEEAEQLLVGIATSLIRNPPEKRYILYRGTLSVLISTFENFISDILHYHYKRFPNALSEDHTITLAELRQFETIQDFEKDLASKEIKRVIDGGIQEIRKWFEKQHKINLSVLDKEWNRITEIFARRNIEIHNNGLVDKTYLRRVHSTITEEYNAVLGEKLYFQIGYLERAIDYLYYCGYVILLGCWAKWDKSQISEGCNFIVESINLLLEAERFNVVCLLSEYALTIPKLLDEQRAKISDTLSIAREKMNHVSE